MTIAVTPAVPHCDLTTLCSDILEEAKNPTGTWLLAMHNRVLSAIRAMRPDQFERFLIRIIQRMASPDVTGRERFKLAQICTVCLGTNSARVSEILPPLKPQIMAAMVPLGYPLDQPIAKLLSTLCEDNKRRKSPATFAVRCRVERPRVSRRFGVLRTPEP